MSDIAAQPFINYGLSGAEQQKALAGANLENQQAGLANQQSGLVGQQTQQAAMATELQRRAMPMYRQNLDQMMAEMSGTAANSNIHTGEAPASPGNLPGNAAAEAPGDAPDGSPGNAPAVKPYADSGAIAEARRKENWIEPVTQQEQQRIYRGVVASMMPGGSPAFLEQAKMQREYRVMQQTNAAQYRSSQLYDTMTAVADPNNKDPLGALGALPGQAQVAAKIKQDHQGDDAGAQDAARKYAELTAFHVHQYTGNPTDLQNGVLVDTKKGQPVTGQHQVLTGLSSEQRDKFMQYVQQDLLVKFTDNTSQPMARWKAPVDQGGYGGITPDALLRRQDAFARQNFNDPNFRPGATSWDAPTAIGNRPANAKAPGTTSTGVAPAPGAKPATGAALQQINQNPPPKPADITGPAPPSGTPAYEQRVGTALQDPDYKARFAPANLPHVPGAPIPGADEGVKTYMKDQGELRTYGGQISQTSATSMMNLRAAKEILSRDTALPLTGPFGAIAQKLSALGYNTDTATARQEAAKYLTNFAVSSLKETYGSRPAAFDVKINLEQAFPNVSAMGSAAIKDLIDSQMTQAQYLKDSGERAQRYANGKSLEPGSFPTWNEKYFPKEDILKSNANAPPTGAETRPYQGKNYYLKPGADRSKQENWVAH